MFKVWRKKISRLLKVVGSVQFYQPSHTHRISIAECWRNIDIA